MIRLSEIRLPFTVAEAPEAPLRAAAAQILGVADTDIAHLHVFKRSFDARKADLLAVYIVDVTLAQPAREAELLAIFSGSSHIQPTPDMAEPLALCHQSFIAMPTNTASARRRRRRGGIAAMLPPAPEARACISPNGR